jgi:hypothetical protein
MKGFLIILLFTGQTYLKPFEYDPGSTDNDEIILACSNKAEQLRQKLSTHSWDDPRGQGWYLRDGTGTFQGYIC